MATVCYCDLTCTKIAIRKGLFSPGNRFVSKICIDISLCETLVSLFVACWPVNCHAFLYQRRAMRKSDWRKILGGHCGWTWNRPYRHLSCMYAYMHTYSCTCDTVYSITYLFVHARLSLWFCGKNSCDSAAEAPIMVTPTCSLNLEGILFGPNLVVMPVLRYLIMFYQNSLFWEEFTNANDKDNMNRAPRFSLFGTASRIK